MTYRRLLVASVLALPLAVGVVVPGSTLSPFASAAAAEEDEERETRKTPALREASYKRLAETQELIDANDYEGALEVLRKMGESRGMNAYEIASMHNMRAFVYFNQEDYPNAIGAYEDVLAQRPEIPLALEQSTLYALGQLYFVQEDYRSAIRYLSQWFDIADNPGPQPFVFLAQAYYQLEEFEEVPPRIQTAMDVARERDQEVKENWWLLMRAAYYEMENMPKVIEILEVLVRDFPKKEYWVQLSGLYGNEGDFEKQLNTIWAAWIQGMLDQEREILNLTGLMLQAENPFWSARILAQEIEDGVVEASSKNLQQLGQAWQIAQEVDRAIPAYERAAAKADGGELYYRLAQLHLDKDQCEESIDAADSALERGDLDDLESQVHLVKGMCQYNLDRYTAAIESFTRGQRIARREDQETDLKSLTQWKRYVENEKKRSDELARSASS